MARIANIPQPSSLEQLEPRRLFTTLHGALPASDLASDTLPHATLEWANEIPAWFLESVNSEKLLLDGKVIDTMYLPLVEILEKRELLAAREATQPGLGSGLEATYYDNADLTGPAVARIDPAINFNWNTAPPARGIGADSFSVRWEGYVEARYGQLYTFSTTSDDGVRLWVDGQLLIDNWTSHAPTVDTGTISLKAGRKYAIRMEYFDSTGGAVAQLRWSSESQPQEIIPRSQLFPGQGHYRTAPFAIGQQIEAEDFDNGGQDIAYYDTGIANDLGHYRNASVDIGLVPGGGYYVGSTKPKEWLEYTLHVDKSGTYDLHLRTASDGAGGVVHLKADGQDQTGPISIPNTGDWQVYTTTRTEGIYLSAGTHTLRLSLDTAGGSGLVGNINWLKLVPSNLTILGPGSGFVGATPEPAAVSPEAPYGDAKAIARWDVVPFQTFTGNFNVGVVAFHAEGIKKVSFSVNGSDWQDVYEMTLNPETDVIEYWATLKAVHFADGALEVRAIAHPNVGQARVLEPLTLYANPNATLAEKTVYVSLSGDDAAAGTEAAPVRSIHRAIRVVREDGGANGGRIVLLDEGFYELPYYSTGTDGGGSTSTPNERWLTITSADGLNRDAVILGRPADGPTARMRISRMKLESVSIDFTALTQFYVGPEDGIWFDQTRWFSTNSGDTQTGYPVRTTSNSFVTDSRAHDLKYGFVGIAGVRNATLVNVRGDSFASNGLIINARVSAVSGTGGEAFHSDVLQYSGDADNIIVYGVKAFDLDQVQVMFLEPTIYSTLGMPQHTMSDVAFINIDIDYTGDAGSPPYSQMISRFEHVIFRNVKMPKQRLIMRTDFTTNNQAWYSHNVLFDDSLFYAFPSTMPDGVEWR